jgi:hypothetical protein
VTFLTKYNITILLHVFVFCVTCITRHCIHSLFSLHFRVFPVNTKSLSWVTWRTFYSDTRPQIILSFSLYKKNILSGFAIGHPGQRRVPQLVLNIRRYLRTTTRRANGQNLGNLPTSNCSFGNPGTLGRTVLEISDFLGCYVACVRS